MTVIIYLWVSWARTCSRRCCELRTAFTAAAETEGGSVVPKDSAGPFPVVWGEPVQEHWDAAAALPAPAALAGEKRRKEVFIASETRLLLGAARMTPMG